MTANSTNNIIMVASGKGGVGKTWFSITLSSTLAQFGKNVLLFDGDLGLANVDIQLGLMPKKDLNSVISGECSMDEAIINHEPKGFDIIAGRSGGGQLASLPTQQLAFIREELKRLAQKYDAVVIDLGAGVGGTVRSLSELGGECLVVLTDEPTSLTDAYAFIKVLHAKRPELVYKIVVNWVENEKEGLKVFETLKKSCETFIKISPQLAGIIKRDPHVKDSIRAQKNFILRYPNSEAAQDVEKIAEHFKSLSTAKEKATG